jgi:hypothetical protein
MEEKAYDGMYLLLKISLVLNIGFFSAYAGTIHTNTDPLHISAFSTSLNSNPNQQGERRS